MVRQAPVICVMVPPIHLGAWSMALMLWLPFELLLLLLYFEQCQFLMCMLWNVWKLCMYFLRYLFDQSHIHVARD